MVTQASALTKPLVIIPEASYKHIMYYVRACEQEISGFFDVSWSKELKAFVVGQVYLLDQEVTSTETELNDDAIARFNHQLIKQGVTQLPRGWWHSHVDMATFWSPTDLEAMANLANDTFTISIVANKAFELKAKLNCYAPFEFSIDDLVIQVEDSIEDIPQTIIDEIAQKVKVKVKAITVYTPNLYSTREDKTGYRIDPSIRYATLPKDKFEALTKIENLDLMRVKQGQMYVYKDLNTGTTWYDTWKVITEDDYKKLMGFAEVDQEDIDGLVSNLEDGLHDY